MSNLYNLDQEKQFLSAAIRTPNILVECPHITMRDFSTTNRVVFDSLRWCITTHAEFSKFLLIDRLISLNIRIGDAIDPATYVNALEGLAVNEKAGIGIAKDLKRTTVRRELNEMGRQVQKVTEKDEQKKAGELVAEVTEIFNKQTNLFSGDDADEPRDLYGTVDRFLDQESFYDTRSVPSPFPIYNDLYGFFDPADLYVFCARMKVGKSTLLMSMLQQLAMMDGKNDGFVALILDTELTTEEVQSRAIASLSGVKEFYIRHKLYRRSKEMTAKVEQARELMRPLWAKVQHCYIGGKPLDEQLSIARRWVFKHVTKTGKRGLVALDYFKLSANADFDAKSSRDIVIGKKVNAYKDLAKELKVPVIALVQANRENEDSKGAVKVQNSNVVAGSDMIAQFCSNIYLLEKLTPEERAFLHQTETDSATHTLKLIAPRQLGPNEMGQDCLVKYQDKNKTRYCENYLLYSFRQFVVKEIGTFRDLIAKAQTVVTNVQPSSTPDTQLL